MENYHHNKQLSGEPTMPRKLLLVAIAVFAAATAHAHRPQIIDCGIYSNVAAHATADRDGGTTLDASLGRTKAAYRYDPYLPTYIELTRDVFAQQSLQGASSNVVEKAAERACLKHNQEERRTRELD
ncbi:hypothetical protein AB4851_08820 [Burkholderia sp. 22PA0099]|uniref:hypothetical protein n=1 Tax=Burkholderia sp. 22PA0099 TaxID=3237372 RepID=UPI0039C0F27D